MNDSLETLREDDLFPACFRSGSADLMNVKSPLTHCCLFLTTGVSEEKGTAILICPEYGNCYSFPLCGQEVDFVRAV